MIDSSIRANLSEHIIATQAQLYGTIEGATFEITPDWVRGCSGLRWPNFNIFLPRTRAGLSDDNLADAAAFFADEKVLYSVEIIHDYFPEGPDFLDKRGYQALPPQPAMYLQNFPKDVQQNPEVQIERVSTVPSLTAFCTLLHQVFDFPLGDLVKLFPVSHLKNEVIHHFVAFMDEQPVGTGTAICLADVVSIWNLCTIDQYRQHGVATTLLYQMLKAIGENYFEAVMLYSNAQAYHMFNKFGFEIFTQRQWFLPPGLDYGDDQNLE